MEKRSLRTNVLRRQFLGSDDDGTDLQLFERAELTSRSSAKPHPFVDEWMMLLLEDDDGGTQHRFQVGLNIAF